MVPELFYKNIPESL